MIKSKVSIVFEQKDISIFEELEFSSPKEEIDVLNKIEILHKNDIKLNYINNDLIEILTLIDTTPELLKKLRKIYIKASCRLGLCAIS